MDKSAGKCAKYVRLALEAGGINTSGHPVSAKDYGSHLSNWGFTPVSSTNYKPVMGDINVIQPYTGGSPHGHIQMYNGSLQNVNKWVRGIGGGHLDIPWWR